MKRKFFFLAVGALALTACTSEDVINDVEKSRNVIGFDNVVNKLTRADDPDLTNGTLKQFNVFGYYTTPDNAAKAVKVFDDVTVTRADDGTWGYYNPAIGVDYSYWVPNAHYYFYAYSCGSVTKLNSNYGSFSMDMTNDLMPSNRVLKINDYLCDATHQHDLIYASNTGATEENPWAGILAKASGNPLVTFQFKHLLSKVKAKFTSKFPAGYKVTISDVSLQNIRNIGDYNPNANDNKGGWQNVVRKENGHPYVYLLNTGDNTINPIFTTRDGEPAVTNSAYVLPYAYNGADGTENSESTWVYIKFTITLENNGENVLVKELTGKFNPNWGVGCSYTYNVELSGDAANLQTIAFTTGTDANGNIISSWSNDETPKIIIDNK